MSAAMNVAPDTTKAPRVAYMMSRFPKLTETFVLFELLEVERQGAHVEIYPLLRERASTVHPEAVPVVARAHYAPFLSLPIAVANLRMLLRRPRAYLGSLMALLWGTLGSLRFFVGALGIFPKSVYFAEQMVRDGITHVHAHFASHPAAAAFIIRRLVGIPFSFTAHGSDLHRDRHMLAEKVSEAAFVVAISSYNREVIAEACKEQDRQKSIVIHCGVDTDVFRPQREGDTEAADRPLSMLCVGTLHEVKGQAFLIDACRRLAERGLDVRCDFVGGGPDRADLEKQVREAGLESRVRFLGERTRAEVAELLGRTDVVVAPSVPTADGRREGIPVALMEAAASGAAVVASRLSGIPELIEDGKEGLLVPPRDTGALADALARLCTDGELRQQLGRDGRMKVLNEFDLGANAAELLRRFTRETPT